MRQIAIGAALIWAFIMLVMHAGCAAVEPRDAHWWECYREVTSVTYDANRCDCYIDERWVQHVFC